MPKNSNLMTKNHILRPSQLGHKDTVQLVKARVRKIEVEKVVKIKDS